MHQSGEKDRRGPLTKQAPKYLRWAMLETTMHALRHPAYNERYQRNKKRLGRQRGTRNVPRTWCMPGSAPAPVTGTASMDTCYRPSTGTVPERSTSLP